MASASKRSTKVIYWGSSVWFFAKAVLALCSGRNCRIRKRAAADGQVLGQPRKFSGKRQAHAARHCLPRTHAHGVTEQAILESPFILIELRIPRFTIVRVFAQPIPQKLRRFEWRALFLLFGLSD